MGNGEHMAAPDARQLLVDRMREKQVPPHLAECMADMAMVGARGACMHIGRYLETQCGDMPPLLLCTATVALMKDQLARVESDIERQLAERGDDPREVRTAFDLPTLRQQRQSTVMHRA